VCFRENFVKLMQSLNVKDGLIAKNSFENPMDRVFNLTIQ
jgi:hypothetical protein